MKKIDEHIPIQHIFSFLQSWWRNAAIRVTSLAIKKSVSPGGGGEGGAGGELGYRGLRHIFSLNFCSEIIINGWGIVHVHDRPLCWHDMYTNTKYHIKRSISSCWECPPPPENTYTIETIDKTIQFKCDVSKIWSIYIFFHTRLFTAIVINYHSACHCPCPQWRTLSTSSATLCIHVYKVMNKLWHRNARHHQNIEHQLY